ncbi:hypothetical protein DL769_001384 [Monosporascus sp. CRB-8-3]|nr:hypothetical protein DL769_001384 [Monosporascus sp. CRB-8-3]
MALQNLQERLNQAEMRLQMTGNNGQECRRSRGLGSITSDPATDPTTPNSGNNQGLPAVLPVNLDLEDPDQYNILASWDQATVDEIAAAFQHAGGDMMMYQSTNNGTLSKTDAAVATALSSPAGDDHTQPLSNTSPARVEHQQIPPDSYMSCVQIASNPKGLQLSQDTFHHLQALALKYAVCMAGAHVSRDPQLEEQCYFQARFHLEQAELEVRGSCIWTLEAVQALLLVARYEYTHFGSPRATLTMHEEMRSAFFAALSMGFRKPSITSLSDAADGFRVFGNLNRKRAAKSQGEPKGSIFDPISPSIIEHLEPFSLLVVSLRVSAEADQHHWKVAADMEGSVFQYNFCHYHDRIETEIATLVSHLTAIPASAAVAQPGDEMLVLAVIIALGARIQLYNTAILHGRMAKFLDPAANECRRQNSSTAHDISDILLRVDVLDSSKVSIYREAGFFILPSLALAAEAHLTMCQAQGAHTADGNRPYASHETRKSLEAIYLVMEACNDDTKQYDDHLRKYQAFLDATRPGKQLRTEFSSLTASKSRYHES